MKLVNFSLFRLAPLNVINLWAFAILSCAHTQPVKKGSVGLQTFSDFVSSGRETPPLIRVRAFHVLFAVYFINFFFHY